MEAASPDFPPDVLPHGPGFDEALRAMADRPYLASQGHQTQQWRAHRQGLHPWLKEFDKVFVRRMGELGVPMFCHTAIRSAEEQAQVAADGFSKLKDGPHMYGLAVDIVHGRKAWNLSRKQWELIGHIGKEVAQRRGLDLEWGGDWRDPWDPAHWQVKGWRSLAGGYPFKVEAYRD